MINLAQVKGLVSAHAAELLIASAVACVALALALLMTARSLIRRRNELLLLIERIDLAIGTNSEGKHEIAGARVEEYAGLTTQLIKQLRANSSPAPAAGSGAGAETREPDGAALKNVTEQMDEFRKQVASLMRDDGSDLATLATVLDLDRGLSAAHWAIEQLRSGPLRRDTVDDAVRSGVFDLPLSTPSLLEVFFPEASGVISGATRVEEAVEAFLHSADITVERVPPLQHVAADDKRVDLRDHRGLRRVPKVRATVAVATLSGHDEQRALVTDCYQPGFLRGDQEIRRMKVSVFNRAEWAEPIAASLKG